MRFESGARVVYNFFHPGFHLEAICLTTNSSATRAHNYSQSRFLRLNTKEGEVVCSYCGSEEVEPSSFAFTVITSKKSA
jgi:hypothetical protein